MGKFCNLFGFDDHAIASRLRLLGLEERAPRLEEQLQERVIAPSMERILEEFYEGYMLRHEEFRRHLGGEDRIRSLKHTQARYLSTLGVDVQSERYHEDRLRIGVIHRQAGIPLPLYECSYNRMREILFRCARESDVEEPWKVIEFIGRVTSLDMSLAIEAYHQVEVVNLKRSMDTLVRRGEALMRQLGNDPLTDMPNRATILSTLESVLKEHGASAQMALSLINVDGMTAINRDYGRLVGDHVLREVAGRLQAEVVPSHFIGRYGGAEFLAILLPAANQTVQDMTERLRQAVGSRPVMLRGNALRVTVSQGAARVAEAGSAILDLLSAVESSLTDARAAGGDTVCWYQPPRKRGVAGQG
ncbi:MAG TPA: diguanylate cyclase [Thiotrichales bacterium]|nr:diguanylate cyclase [Thiotrichales bacterium]